MRRILYILFICLTASLPLRSNGQMMAATVDRDVYEYWELQQMNKELVLSLTTLDGVNRPNRNRGMLMAGTNALVNGYKQYNLWQDSLHVIYPIVTDTTSTQDYRVSDGNRSARTWWSNRSIKNPSSLPLSTVNLGTGAAMPLYNTNGFWFGRGINQNEALNTSVPLNVFGTLNNMSLSVVATTNFEGSGSQILLGAWNSFGGQMAYIFTSNAINSSSINNGSAIDAGIGTPGNIGMFTFVRYAANNITGYFNTTAGTPNTTTANVTVTNTRTFFLGAVNGNGSIVNPSRRTIGYADIGRGISAVGVARKYEIVNRYFQNINRPTF